MIPVTFPECNVVLAMSQDEYEPLQAYRAPDGQTICAFRLSPQELKEIAETRMLWISVLTFNKPFQPIGLSTQCPFERRPEKASDLLGILDRKVTVCAACLCASCWQGEFYCDNYKTAGTVEKTLRELYQGNLREDSGYWFKDVNTGKVDYDAKSAAKRAWLAENGNGCQ